MKITCLTIFKSITEFVKISRVYMVVADSLKFGRRCVWILNHVSRSVTWSLLTYKASNLIK